MLTRKVQQLAQWWQQLPWPSSAIRKTRRWIADLPLADLERSSELVLQALQRTHIHLQEKPTKQLSILKAFHPVVNHLSTTLQHQYLHDRTVAPQKKRQIIASIQQMHLSLAHSFDTHYQHLVSHETTKHACVYHAMYHTLMALLRCYQLHQPNPVHLWKQMYQLYQTARIQQWVDKPLDAHQPQQLVAQTIGDLFKAAALLGSCHPYQLHTRDKIHLLDYFLSWSSLVDIRHACGDDVIHVIQLNSDEPPIYRQLLSVEEQQSPHVIGLYTRPLVDTLHIEQTSFNHPPYPPLPTAVRQHLIAVWTQFPTRHFPRIPDHGTVKAAVGLAATHFLLSQGSQHEPHHAGDHHMTSQWLIKQLQQEDPHIQVPTIDYPTHDWHLINSSQYGYCLSTHANYPRHLQVGEIIALQDVAEQESAYWHIGVIRWIRYEHDQTLQIGMHMMASHAIPVRIQKVKQDLGTQGLRALLLTDEQQRDQRHSIITPSELYRLSDKLQLSGTGIYQDIFLSNCVDRTQLYQQFYYKLLNTVGN